MKKKEGHIIKVAGEVLYMGTGSRSLSHVGNDAVMPFSAPVMAGNEVCGVMPDDVMMRPQGGGGIDHPKQVQQNKAQTDRDIFHTPGVLVTLKKVCYSLFTRLKTAIYGFIEGQEGLLLHLESQALWLSREYVYYSCRTI